MANLEGDDKNVTCIMYHKTLVETRCDDEYLCADLAATHLQ